MNQQNETPANSQAGDKATFIVKVQFRQNATWQGSIQWLDEKKTQKFRSVLEMIKLIDEALAAQDADQEDATWVQTEK